MPKILVVDDEATIRMLYTEVLTEEGYEVISTGDCEGLMEIIDKQKPDVILLDIRMGQYDGLELLQHIRNAFYDTPVILSTAYSSFKYDLKSLAADYYVTKSADLQELKGKISMALAGSRSSEVQREEERVQGGDYGTVPPTIFLG